MFSRRLNELKIPSQFSAVLGTVSVLCEDLSGSQLSTVDEIYRDWLRDFLKPRIKEKIGDLKQSHHLVGCPSERGRIASKLDILESELKECSTLLLSKPVITKPEEANVPT
jgi:hypothetical protein